MRNEKMNVPTIKAGLDKRRKLADDKYNAALIVQFDSKRKYYHLTDGGGTKKKYKLKDLTKITTKNFFKEATRKAEDVIKLMPVFSFEKFEVQYFSDKFDASNDLVKALRRYANSLPDSRLKTKLGYETVANVVEKYMENKRIEMQEVTPEWLNNFEEYLTSPYMKLTNHKKNPKSIPKDGRSSTTVGIYLRNVRAVILEWYRIEKPIGYNLPFGREKDGLYQIPSGQNVKKALDFEDIAKLYHYELPEGTDIDFYRDLWILSYLANGMNLKDICRLKYRNIDVEKLTFLRSKTLQSRKGNQQKIVVPLTSEIARILDKWSTPGGQNDFVFPILEHSMTPMQELNKIQGLIKRINNAMKEIASQIGIEKNVNTYAARHSFATIAMREGYTVAMISKALGHKSISTTENYLGSFGDDRMRELSERLSDFDRVRPKQEKK